MELNSASIGWDGSGWYVLQDNVWVYVGAWFSQEPAEKYLRWIGINGLPLQKFDSMPLNMPVVQKTIAIPEHRVFCAATAIGDDDWNGRVVPKRVNVVAPNEAVAREAIGIILDEGTYTNQVTITRLEKAQVETLRAGYMPFVDNNMVYYFLSVFTMSWRRVNKEVHN